MTVTCPVPAQNL